MQWECTFCMHGFPSRFSFEHKAPTGPDGMPSGEPWNPIHLIYPDVHGKDTNGNDIMKSTIPQAMMFSSCRWLCDAQCMDTAVKDEFRSNRNEPIRPLEEVCGLFLMYVCMHAIDSWSSWRCCAHSETCFTVPSD